MYGGSDRIVFETILSKHFQGPYCNLENIFGCKFSVALNNAKTADKQYSTVCPRVNYMRHVIKKQYRIIIHFKNKTKTSFAVITYR